NELRDARTTNTRSAASAEAGRDDARLRMEPWPIPVVAAPRKRGTASANQARVRTRRLFGMRKGSQPVSGHANYTNVAFSVICVPASACDTGQFAFAVSACSWNVASSIPGTDASVTRSMRLMGDPLSPVSRLTLAVVWTRSGVKPARPRPPDRAIEKQPAWAAPMSSSGLVPLPSSKREANEYWPSNAPEPKRIVPLPSWRLPSHWASAVRLGMAGQPTRPVRTLNADHRSAVVSVQSSDGVLRGCSLQA